MTRDTDRGLGPEIKHRLYKVAPDAKRVKEFAKMLSDPRMLNKRGIPRYSKIFRTYGIDSFAKGFTGQVMAAAQYPDEVDIDGCPSSQSTKSVTGYLKRLTKKFEGNLELYSTRGQRETVPHIREHRWHITKYKADHNRQVDDMRKIATSINLAAKKRIVNFEKKTYPERMQKVDLLDQFFDRDEE
jgi:hypothetical protein